MNISNVEISLERNHCSQQHLSNAVVDPITGKQNEFMALMNDPDLQPLYLETGLQQ
jgi:hypothetical protein